MVVSQRFIDLLNLPVLVLRQMAESADITVPAGARHWDYAQSLAVLPRHRLEELSAGFLYAGTTSVSWIRLVRSAQQPRSAQRDAPAVLSGANLNREEVRDKLGTMSSHDPFAEDARPPEVTDDPVLVAAREETEGQMLLTFAMRKRVAQVIHQFERHPVYSDVFFNAVLWPGDGLLEVRSAAARVSRLRRTWLTGFAHELDLEPREVSITMANFSALKAELGATLVKFRGKAPEGGSIDTHEVTKSIDWDDLEGAEDFVAATEGLEPVHGDLVFEHADRQVRINVSVINGSVFFRTSVPEETIAFVRDSLRRVKSRA